MVNIQKKNPGECTALPGFFVIEIYLRENAQGGVITAYFFQCDNESCRTHTDAIGVADPFLANLVIR